MTQAERRSRVLVIDDDPMIGPALRRMLWNDANVAVESTALAALTRLDGGERFDLVLCDVQMPGVLGTDFVRCVQRFVPAAADAVVLMSGSTSRDDVDADSVPFVAKPFEPGVLRAMLRARSSRRPPS